MLAETKKQVEIILHLSENEAIWLRDIMQNPIHVEHPDDEDGINKRYRYDCFITLKKALMSALNLAEE